MKKDIFKKWEKIELADNKEIEKINKMIDRKQAKEVDNWFKRWLKEGYFWRDNLGREKSKKDDWL